MGLYVDYALQYYYMVLHLLYNALIFIARLSANTETHFYLTYKTLCCLWVFWFFYYLHNLLIMLKNMVAYAFDTPQQQVEPVVAKSDK